MNKPDDTSTRQPLVSVVTVCRNSLPQLRKTIDSVARQTFTDYEHIIVDGASTDGTADYLRQLDSPRLQWTSEPDNGIYDAMNKGTARCRGQWTIFMNAGDTFYQSDTLQQVFTAAIPDDTAVIFGDVYKAGRGILQALSPRNAHRMYFCHQSAFTLTSLLRLHPYDLHHPRSADFKLYKQLYLEGRHFLQLPVVIADFDTTGISNTSRAAGIADNIAVVRECDNAFWQSILLPRLYFQYFMCKIRKALR